MKSNIFRAFLAILVILPATGVVSQDFTSSILPVILINTNGQFIQNRERIIAEMKVINNGPGNRNHLSDEPNNYNGQISIEIRGSSSSWFPKQQYAIETQTELGENNNVSLLGLPKENDWVLYAPYSDKSLVRNVLEYELARRMGRYASRTRLCELVLNGDYHGVYVLMEKIKRDKNRVDIATLNPDEISGDDLTGGYIIKIDKRDGEQVAGWYSPYPPYSGSTASIYYQYHDPRPDDIVTEQKNYIQNYFQDFEHTIFNTDYSDPQNALPDFLDIPSFVDFFILNEIGRNVDGYRLSAFMYKDKDSNGGKLTMGPLWDFNLAFGNADYYNGGSVYGWQVDFKGYNDGFQIPFWWQKLLKSDDFRKMIHNRWTSLREDVLNLDQVFGYIDSLVADLSEAQVRNFIRWPVLGTYIWPNQYVFDTYAEEIDYLKEWIEYRFEWMDQNIPKSTLIPDSHENTPHFVLHQNYPNPFNSSTAIPYSLSAVSSVELRIYTLLGQLVHSVIPGIQNPGYYTVYWDADDYESGIYFYELIIESQAEESVNLVRKMIMTR